MARVPIEEIESATRTSETVPCSLPFLAQVALRRGKMIGILSVVFVALAAVVASLLPARYTATVLIMPPQGGSSSAAMLAQLGNLGAMASLGGAMPWRGAAMAWWPTAMSS